VAPSEKLTNVMITGAVSMLRDAVEAGNWATVEKVIKALSDYLDERARLASWRVRVAHASAS
jgi:hypothetical protein